MNPFRFAGYKINQSIRFNDDDLAYMSRTPASAGNRKTWTFSCWVKRGNLGLYKTIFSARTDDNNRISLRFSSGDNLQLFGNIAGITALQLDTTQVFRDPSAHLHIQVILDTTHVTASSRATIIINGVAVSAFITATYPALNDSFEINNTVQHSIGRLEFSTPTQYFDGYLAETIIVDGSALTASDFGETDINGNWTPKKFKGSTTIDPVSQLTGTAIGDMTGAGGLAAAFDGNDDQTGATVGGTGSLLPSPGAFAHIGKDWGSGNTKIINNVLMWNTTDQGWNQGINTGTNTFVLQGSNDNFSADINDLGSGSIAETTGRDRLIIFATDTTTAYRYHRIKISHSAGNYQPCLSELYFQEQSALSTGNYGTNGFYIDGANAASLGTDVSGNGNNFTTSGLTTADQMLDSPTDDAVNDLGNYCTWNPLQNGSFTLVSGNLKINSGSNDTAIFGTFGVSSGKWYAEFTTNTVGNSAFGISNEQAPIGGANQHLNANNWYFEYSGSKVDTARTAYGSAIVNGDIVQLALDMDNGKVWWGINNTWQATGDPVAGTNAAFTGLTGTIFPNFAMTSTIVPNIESNFGQSGFTYTPPTGFKALNTANLPAPAIPDPSAYFQAKAFTGTGASNTIVLGGNTEMQPDLVWIKDRDTAVQHVLTDSVRGATKELNSDSTNVETTVAQGLTSFDTDGFTLGTDINYNASLSSNIAWAWKKGASPGFDIALSTDPSEVVPHSLGAVPAMAIGFDRDVASSHSVWHSAIHATSGNSGRIYLESSAVNGTGTQSILSLTSTNFTLGSHSSFSDNWVWYLWSEVAGFSKFGYYTGNGSADGPFVHCGFRPAFLLIKHIAAAEVWNITDSARDTYNVAGTKIYANSTATEWAINANRSLDMTSNGFKLRGIAGEHNTLGGTYIYMAFAEHPFGGAGASQARAR